MSQVPPARPAPGRRARRQAVLWAMALVVVATALSIGVFGSRPPRSDAERVQSIAKQVACPTCQGQSAAESNAPAAENIRNEIARLVDAGRPEDEILERLAVQFEGSSLRPSSSGAMGLVWVIPVVVGVVAGAGLVLVFRRWAAAERLTPSAEDRELVERYLAEQNT